MFRYVIASVLLATLAMASPTFPGCEKFITRVHIQTDDTSSKSTKITANVCESQNLIHYDVKETDMFVHVEGLDDYNTGFSAEKYGDECILSKLKYSDIKEKKEEIMQTQDKSVGGQGNFDVYDVTDSDIESFGDEINNFCKGTVMKKVGEDSYTELANFEDPTGMERIIALPFTGCVLLCFQYICFTTTLTAPTGSTVTFVWFFG